MRVSRRGKLSPVGEPIVFRGPAPGNPMPAGFTCELLNSGTASLALAMQLAKRRSGLSDGEVILPAYGCPDLVAAADFAGLTPVLVDIEADSPRFKLEQLAAAIKPATVAVTAVNFLGLGEDIAAIRSLIAGSGITLIEDNAQYYPVDSQACGFEGDLVVLSFGRGKPISQMGGGALLAAQPFSVSLQDAAAALPLEGQLHWRWQLKARIFNLVLHPGFYQFLQLLPFLRIGETRYHALDAIARMDPWRTHYLHLNVAAYQQRSRQIQARLAALLASVGMEEMDLCRRLRVLDNVLLRYPLLCDSPEQCDRLYARLSAQGLGASRMYEQPLPQVSGVRSELQGDFPGAASFARRLLTLPTTSFVSERHLQALANCLREPV